MEKVQNPHKRITLDVKSGVLRWFEAREKLRQIAKALEMASEVFRMGGAGRGVVAKRRHPGFLDPGSVRQLPSFCLVLL